MSGLTAEQRGDLAEAMLPVAANLAVLVHGDGGPEDIAQVLAGLNETQKNAVIVVLAGMVDPDQPVGKGLSWTAVTKNGALPVPAWMEQKPLRDHAPDTTEALDDDFVDWAAVAKFVKGFPVDITDADFLAAVQECLGLGMTLGDVDRLRRWPVKTAENWVNRLKKRYQRAGRAFPALGRPGVRDFTEAEVVRMRERSEQGDSDVEIALSFNVTRETVRAICVGKRYAHFGGPIRTVRSAKGLRASRDFMCGHTANSKAAQPRTWQEPALTPLERDAIHRRTAGGEAVKDLAAEYQVSASTVRDHAA